MRRFLDHRDWFVEIDIENPRLQSFETDQVSFSMSDRFQLHYDLLNGHTIYRAEDMVSGGNTVKLTLRGIDRKKARFPVNALRKKKKTLHSKSSGQALSFQVEVDPKYLPSKADQNKNDSLNLIYQVHTCKPRLLKRCLFANAYDSTKKVYHPLTKPVTKIDINKLKKGYKVYITYTLVRKNSYWYLDNEISKQESNTVLFK